MSNIDKNDVIVVNDAVYNRPTTAVPKPPQSVGIDTTGKFLDNIINAGTSGKLDISELESFTQISQSRNQIYNLLDSMCQDTTVSAILETYAEDATEYNEDGRIVWVESSDKDCLSYISFLLDTLNIDKHIYSWASSLCKYGDLYIRLYRQSDIEKSKSIFTDTKEKLDEAVKVKAFKDSDHYSDYVEMVANPAEIFELTQFGKTEGFIKAEVNTTSVSNPMDAVMNQFKYRFNQRDVEVYDAKSFVHATLEDNSSRTPELVELFNSDDEHVLTYKVRRGQSLFYNLFKIWRELALLENSLLLNRISKSAIVRMINVEVGDMPKEMVGPHLDGIKRLLEQKIALNTDNSLNEYTNPGPIENNIYVPTHGGIGAISSSQIGGDVDVKQLYDIEYYRDKFFGGARVPKQYFGFTDDGAGFNGGTSLSIISSRYAKMIKRIQNTLTQATTDLMNLYLLDKGLDRYINKFTIRMLSPTTQEEIDRRENRVAKIGMIQDMMNLFGDIEDPKAKLMLLKSLMSTVITDEEIIQLIQEQIDALENAKEKVDDEQPVDLASSTEDDSLDLENDLALDLGLSDNSEELATSENEQPDEAIEALPSPEELGVDFSDNSAEF